MPESLTQPIFAAKRPTSLPKVRAGTNEKKDTLEAARDMTRLIRAGLIEETLFLQRTFAAPVIEAGKKALRKGRRGIFKNRFSLDEAAVIRHVNRIAEILAASEVVGRLRSRRQAQEQDDRVSPVISTFAETFPGSIPPDDIVEFIRGLEAVPKAEWEFFVEKYQRFAFTVAGAENQNALIAVRNLLAQAVADDWSEARFVSEARDIIPTIRSRLVWNNNVGFAMRRGRFRELRSPAVAKVLPWLFFDALNDNVVRPNHAKLDNGVAPSGWKGWARFGPPLGHNCRCQLSGLTASRAQAMIASGRAIDLTKGIPRGAGPDKGFRKGAF